MSYFTEFPQVDYGGTKCIDITRRVRLQESILRQPTLFYPFVLKNEMRPDTLAFDYYKDPSAEWVVQLANQIIDPYYGWYLSDDEFNAYILKKYGNFADAQSKIHHWETNWSDNDFNISVEHYNEGLPETLKKYWIPNYGFGSKVISYRRRQESWTASTNQIAQINVGNGSSFASGERVDFFQTGQLAGTAEVMTANSDTLIVQHVQNNVLSSSLTVVGQTSNAQSNTASGSSVLQQVIPFDEMVYWSPVFIYDLELANNEKNKFVTLIDVNYFPQLQADLKTKLAQ